MSARLAFRRFGALPVSRALEFAFGIAVIYMFTCGWLPLSAASQPDPVAGDPSSVDGGLPIYYTVNTIIYLISIALVLKRPQALWRAMTADLFLTALVGLALVSMLWSATPDIVLRRWVALFGTTVFAVYLHLRYTMEEQLRLVGWGLGLTAVLSVVLLTPGAVSEGMFAGMYENKNSLGRMMALSTLIFVLLASSRRPRSPAIAFAGLSFTLLLLANSSTALVVTLTILGIMPLSRMLARDIRLAVGVGGLAVLLLGIGLLLVTSNLSVVTGMVGRDATLTGRTDLWQFVAQAILKRPWLGYGYETFWLWELPWRIAVDEGAGWTAPNAHNGFLEVGLALGLVGLFLFVVGLVRGLAKAVRYLHLDPRRTGSWPLMYLCYVLLYNVTEIAVLARNSLVWVLYVTALLAVASRSRGADAVSVGEPVSPGTGRLPRVSEGPRIPVGGHWQSTAARQNRGPGGPST